MPVVRIERGRVLLETHPAVKDELREPIACFAPERRGSIESPANFRRIDAEEPDAAVERHVDRVAVDYRADEERV